MAKYFRDNFEWDFGGYLSQIHVVSSKVSDSIKKFSDCLEKQKEEKGEDIEIIEDFGSAELNSDLVSSLVSLSDNLKSEVYYNSLLISAFSFLEFSVLEYCRLIEGYIKEDIELNNFKQIGLTKANKFLIKAVDLDISTLPNWESIDEYRKHRNLIVHNNSNIIHKPNKPLNEQKDFEIFSSNGSLEITSTGHIFILNIDYINSLLDIAVDFLNEIIEKTKEKIDVE
jgi:hypothetical protein